MSLLGVITITEKIHKVLIFSLLAILYTNEQRNIILYSNQKDQ